MIEEDEVDVDGFKEFLAGLKVITSDELGALLHSCPDKIDSPKLVCKFYHLKCNAKEPRERGFIMLLMTRLIIYVLDRKECLPVGATTQSVLTKARDLTLKAKRKFIENNPKSGEAGELILFLLLESQGIIQVVSKMKSKTAKEMHVHGLDGIHIEANGNLIMHYGEAKMYENLDSAIDSALCSIRDYTTNTDKQDIEVDIISDFMDESKFGEYAGLIKNLVNPYAHDHSLLDFKNSVFIGHDWNTLSSIAPIEGKKLDDMVLEEYEKTLDTVAKRVKDKIQAFENEDVRKQDFVFHVIPFKNVGKFREKFLRELSRDK